MQAVALVSQLTIWISVLIYFTNVNPLFKCPISLVHFSDQENAQSSQNFDKTHEKGQEENDFNLQRANQCIQKPKHVTYNYMPAFSRCEIRNVLLVSESIPYLLPYLEENLQKNKEIINRCAYEHTFT